MTKQFTANYATIDSSKSVIQIYETEPRTSLSYLTLKDVTIKIDGTIIEVKGDEIRWSFTFNKTFSEDLKYKPSDEYTWLGYRTISDFFKGIKKPYVKMGWYKLKETTPYYSLVSKWFLIL